ncbi:BrnA antitoxin family protein [Bilophila wadsworthia]
MYKIVNSCRSREAGSEPPIRTCEASGFPKRPRIPMCGKPKVAVTIRLDQTTVNYFKNLSEEMKMPYQTLISSFLAECAAKKMKPSITWR